MTHLSPFVLLAALTAGWQAPPTTTPPDLSKPAPGEASSGFAAIKQWKAEVVVTSDCNRVAFDGSRTVIHNRIVTTYEFTRRAPGASVMKWNGRASTTYRWAVGTESREGRDIEESSGTFESDAELELTGSTRISVSRPPGQPFVRRKFQGDALIDTASYKDEPPQAELFEVPLPSATGTLTGDRMEAAYSLLGGVVLICPAQRQWTLRAP